jgi:hypothetical protein
VNFFAGEALGPEHKGHILGHGALGNQFVILKHDANAAAHHRQPVAAQFSDGLISDQNAAAGGALIAVEQLEQGGFARARGAGDEEKIAGVDGEVDAGQGLLPLP